MNSELWLTKHDIENAYHPIIGGGKFSGELGTHPATNSNENYGVWSEQNRKLVDPFWGIAGFFTGFEGKFGEDATNEIEYELDGGQWESIEGDNTISWRNALLNSMDKHPDEMLIYEAQHRVGWTGGFVVEDDHEDTLVVQQLDFYDYYDEDPFEFLDTLRVEIGEWYEGREDFYDIDEEEEEEEINRMAWLQAEDEARWIREIDKPLNIKLQFKTNYELKKDLPSDFVPNPRYRKWKSTKVTVRMKGGKLSTFGGRWETNGEARFVPKSSLMSKDSVSSCNPAKGICNCMTSYRKKIPQVTFIGNKRRVYFAWVTKMPRIYNKWGRLTRNYRNACFNKPGWGKNAKKDSDATIDEHITTTILKAAPRRKFQLKGASKPKKAEQPTKATAPTRRRERKRGGVLQSFKQD